jgi:hypothetical protein
MKCEIKLCPLLIVEHIESIFQTLLMLICDNFFAFEFCIHLFVIIHLMIARFLWNFMMNAFISMLMLVDMHYYFLQSCVNMVFRHDWRPPSFSLISRAIMLHWLVYKLSNMPSFLAL